jgi:hypothetical protein
LRCEVAECFHSDKIVYSADAAFDCSFSVLRPSGPRTLLLHCHYLVGDDVFHFANYAARKRHSEASEAPPEVSRNYNTISG